MSIEAGLADQHAQSVSEFVCGRGYTCSNVIHPRACTGAHRAGDPGRGTEFAEHLAQRARPFAGGDTRARTCQRSIHQIRTAAGIADQSSERLIHCRLIARRPPKLKRRNGLGLHFGIDLDD